ncbi:MAG TPA: FAD-dependent oxidoreductase [Phycisphaerae bacterium]|nr:FAD-dependent oxidoreductase [Phycisphaerae bacterium]
MIRPNTQPDVVIVGAGPAGCSAAIRLARAGHSVTVCEGAIFPRRKVCGGCLSGDAVALLVDLLGEKVAELGTPVTRITFGIGRRTFSTFGDEHCRIVRRDILDATLAEAAAAAGARLEFGQRAEIVEESRGSFSIRTAARYWQPRWIIWAAGLTDLVKHKNLKRQDLNRAMFGQAWSVAPMDVCPPVGEIAMHWLQGGYVGLATVSPVECLVGLAVERNGSGSRKPSDILRAANSKADVLQVLELPTVAPKLGTANFPHRPQHVGYGNVLIAGDAAGFEEPFSGEGIGQALRSGLAAARALLTDDANDFVISHYRKQLRQHRRVRRRTRWLSQILRNRVVFTFADSHLPGLETIGGHLLRGVHVNSVTEGI